MTANQRPVSRSCDHSQQITSGDRDLWTNVSRTWDDKLCRESRWAGQGWIPVTWRHGSTSHRWRVNTGEYLQWNAIIMDRKLYCWIGRNWPSPSIRSGHCHFGPRINSCYCVLFFWTENCRIPHNLPIYSTKIKGFIPPGRAWVTWSSDVLVSLGL